MNSTNLPQFKQSLRRLVLCLPESDPDLLLLISRDDLLDPDEKFLIVTGLAVLPTHLLVILHMFGWLTPPPQLLLIPNIGGLVSQESLLLMLTSCMVVTPPCSCCHHSGQSQGGP